MEEKLIDEIEFMLTKEEEEEEKKTKFNVLCASHNKSLYLYPKEHYVHTLYPQQGLKTGMGVFAR